MFKTYSLEVGGRTLSVDIDRIGKQAGGCAFMHYGDTTVSCFATASEKPRDGIDFFPLSVEYTEKFYAVGKFPGGFNKREGRPSENAILTSRVIDRPMRPLFPKDMRNDVTLECLVMSVEPACRPELVAMNGAALATEISDIPFDGPVAMTQIGMVNGEVIINPSQEQWDKGDLQLTVASREDKIMMIEAGANEIPDEEMIRCIYIADEQNKRHEVGQGHCADWQQKHEYESCAILRSSLRPSWDRSSLRWKKRSSQTANRREGNVSAFKEKLREAFAENEEWLASLTSCLPVREEDCHRRSKDNKRALTCRVHRSI